MMQSFGNPDIPRDAANRVAVERYREPKMYWDAQARGRWYTKKRPVNLQANTGELSGWQQLVFWSFVLLVMFSFF